MGVFYSGNFTGSNGYYNFRLGLHYDVASNGSGTMSLWLYSQRDKNGSIKSTSEGPFAQYNVRSKIYCNGVELWSTYGWDSSVFPKQLNSWEYNSNGYMTLDGITYYYRYQLLKPESDYGTVSFSGGSDITLAGYMKTTASLIYVPAAGEYGVSGTIHLAPYNVSTSPSSITRTSVNLSRSWSGTATACQYYISGVNSGNWISEGATVGGVTVSGNSIIGLTPNTSYNVKIRLCNQDSGWVESAQKTFKTLHNDPVIETPSISYTRTNNLYKTNISYGVTYDYAQYSSHKLEYGTSTSYGSTATSSSTGTSSAFTISNLNSNTTYYYKITETDTGSGTSTKTGQFTTPGVAPTITSTSVNEITAKTAKIILNITYDNTTYKTGSITYKIVGDTSETTKDFPSSGEMVLDELKPGKEYTANITITDDFQRSSSTSIIFKTLGGIQFMGRSALGARLNNLEIIGIRLNGNDVL